MARMLNFGEACEFHNTLVDLVVAEREHINTKRQEEIFVHNLMENWCYNMSTFYRTFYFYNSGRRNRK